MNPPELLFWGDIGFDVYVSGEGAETVRPGGCALNAAISARLAGCEAVGVAGALGPDADPLWTLLAERGIEATLDTRPEPSPRQTIRLGPDGERTLCGYVGGALAAAPPSEDVLRAVERAELVHLPVFDLTLTWAEEAFARRRGRALGLDLMDLADIDDAFVARALREATVVIAGLDAGQHGAVIDRIRRLAAQPDAALAIVTLGAEGALAFDGAREHRVPAATVRGEVVDTTGCGDAFAGTFLARRALGDDLPDALMRAAARAAVVAGHPGAIEP